jgi:hypothetical protein
VWGLHNVWVTKATKSCFYHIFSEALVTLALRTLYVDVMTSCLPTHRCKYKSLSAPILESWRNVINSAGACSLHNFTSPIQYSFSQVQFNAQFYKSNSIHKFTSHFWALLNF